MSASILLMPIDFLSKIWILSLFSVAIKQILKLSQPTFICFRRPWSSTLDYLIIINVYDGINMGNGEKWELKYFK